MNRAVAQEFGVDQSWNHSQDSLLFRNSEPGLEANDVPHVAVPVFPTKLDDGRDVTPSRLPLATLAARLLGLMQAALLAGMLG